MTLIFKHSVKLHDQEIVAKEPNLKMVPKKNTTKVDVFDSSIKSTQFISSSPKIKSPEEAFIRNLDLINYGMIAKNFMNTYMNFDNNQFNAIENILIKPSDVEIMMPRLRMRPYGEKQMELEEWHERHAFKYAKGLLKADEDTRVRHKKRAKEGLGVGGSMTKKTLALKEYGHFAKDNLTIAGTVVKLTDAICGQSIYEMLPLYAARKGPKVGIIISEMTLSSLLSGAGHGLIPLTFGVSKKISDQLNILITLSGEAIIGKILGAKNKKIALHAGLRGAQLELTAVIPGGALIQYYETGMETGGGLAIAAASVADIILRHASKRYASIISKKDLGDERVLYAINQRIDYLSRFLIPYGQYLFTKTTKGKIKKKLLYIITEQMKVLRDLERTKTRALNFYQMALLAERLPPSRQAGIEDACRLAVPDTRRNTHRIVRRCLATLLREKPLSPTIT